MKTQETTYMHEQDHSAMTSEVIFRVNNRTWNDDMFNIELLEKQFCPASGDQEK